jgi:hypothetical protein
MTSSPGPIPANPAEMMTMILQTALVRLYGDVTTAARRGRLTENDIAVIERRAMADLAMPKGIAHEFTDFEAEPAWRKAEHEIRSLLLIIKTARERHIREKP